MLGRILMLMWSLGALVMHSGACFCKLRVLFVSVLAIRALLFGVYLRAPELWELETPMLCR